jgi:hypothetical protein
MARILVVGGLYQEAKGDYPEEGNRPLGEARKCFAAALGREIIRQGHVLLGGGRTSLDAEVATAASVRALQQKLDPRRVIRSWITETTTPTHTIGELIRSRAGVWSQVPRRSTLPEPIQEANVVILLGGWDGTHYAASWARLANKPLVPVATFGLAAAEIFDDEMANFERRYASRLTLDEFQTLNRLLPDFQPDTIEAFAKDVVALAERLITPTEAFVIMSFAEKGDLRDAYNTFLRVCREKGFTAFKVDNHLDAKQRIVPSIMNAIRRAAFIIADVSEPRPNVYYELGFAQALGKDVVTTAREGTQLPFDIFDVPTLYWDCQDTLERKLHTEVDRIAEKFGRQIVDTGTHSR